MEIVRWAGGPLTFALGLLIATVSALPAIAAPTAAEVNDAEWGRQRQPSAGVVLKAQVLLDRARASPGEIDGKMGENTRKALRAFRRMHGLQSGERLDQQVWRMRANYRTLQLEQLDGRQHRSHCSGRDLRFS